MLMSKISKNGIATALITFGATFASLGAVQSATINIDRLAINPMTTEFGIRDDTATTGRDLNGTVITAMYADGSSEQMTWVTEARADGSLTIKGDAVGTGSSLYMAWRGFELNATSLLTSLLFQLADVSTVFDTTFASNTEDGSTPGTKNGFPFEIYSGGDSLVGDIDVTYSGIVNLAGHDAYGDAYTDMFVDFSGLEGGGFLGDMSFSTDMDTLRYAGDLVSPVPLPASLPFLLVGLGGMGLLRKRKSAA